MIDAIGHLHGTEIKGIDALQTPNVVAIQTGIAATLMMRVDAADRTEVVFGRAGVELVQPEEDVSDFLCARHTMTKRSQYAKQEEAGNG